MSLPEHLTTPIAEAKRTPSPRARTTIDGYTVRAGSPTSMMVRLEGETRWRRLMVWQFRNAGTCFIRSKGRSLIVPTHTIPTVKEES